MPRDEAREVARCRGIRDRCHEQLDPAVAGSTTTRCQGSRVRRAAGRRRGRPGIGFRCPAGGCSVSERSPRPRAPTSCSRRWPRSTIRLGVLFVGRLNLDVEFVDGLRRQPKTGPGTQVCFTGRSRRRTRARLRGGDALVLASRPNLRHGRHRGAPRGCRSWPRTSAACRRLSPRPRRQPTRPAGRARATHRLSRRRCVGGWVTPECAPSCAWRPDPAPDTLPTGLQTSRELSAVLSEVAG